MADKSNIVSFDNEPLVLVDSDDVVIGFEEKAAAHRGNGVLHRAFSIFLFNDQGEVLLQQRVRLNRYGLSTGQTPVVATQDAASP